MRFLIAPLLLLFVLTACGENKPGIFGQRAEIEGYSEVCAESEEARLRCQAFDVAADYREAQEFLAALVANPDIPTEAKDALKELDRQATAALDTYVEGVIATGSRNDAAFLAAMDSLSRLNAALAKWRTP